MHQPQLLPDVEQQKVQQYKSPHGFTVTVRTGQVSIKTWTRYSKLLLPQKIDQCDQPTLEKLLRTSRRHELMSGTLAERHDYYATQEALEFYEDRDGLAAARNAGLTERILARMHACFDQLLCLLLHGKSLKSLTNDLIQDAQKGAQVCSAAVTELKTMATTIHETMDPADQDTRSSILMATTIHETMDPADQDPRSSILMGIQTHVINAMEEYRFAAEILSELSNVRRRAKALLP